MSSFFVNGRPVVAPRDDESLLAFLREELSLTSVKNGCSQGVCGTCTVLVDGKAQRACVLTCGKAAGKWVVTCEGLTEREQAVYGYAFAEAGAVQCGFCTPGMVMAAKGLIDAVPDPGREDVKKALRGNLCRCTGYQKIADAVLLAAKLLREDAPVPAPVFTGQLGESIHRVDAVTKALGRAEYVDDMRLDGMVYGSAVRVAYPRARIKSIDTAAAKAVPGVLAVLTYFSIPGARKIGHLRQDWDVLVPVGRTTHYLGDSVALIAAETREALETAKKLVKVEYEVLEPVFSPEEALRPDAPLVHESGNLLSQEHLVRGDADKAIAVSKYVVTNHYSTPPTEHAFLEPECAVARRESDDSVTVWSADQGIYQTRKECAMLLKLPEDRVRVCARMVGGGFGGKEDMSVQHHAALLAWYLDGRPVKVALSRDESILVHPKRHAMEMDFTTACDENGRLTAMKAVIRSDTGAYASLGGPVLQRACTHAAGPYNYHDIDILGQAVYTNNPPAGAFRGFGVPQSCFATECNLNQLAGLVGISPWEIRYRNAVRPGDVLPNGQIVDADAALVETLEAVKPYYDQNPKAGIACALKNSGLGVGVPDTGRCVLHVERGTVHVRTSAACIGQGLGTVCVQIVCDTAGLPPDAVVWDQPDTATTPNSGNTTASRQTLFTGEAARRAAVELKASLSGRTLHDLEGVNFHAEYTGITDKMGSDKPNPVSHIAYGYATHLVELDGDGRVSRVVAAHDVGRAVNPKSVEGQIEGGVVMSLGWSLTEDYPLDRGRPTAKLGTLGLFRATDAPRVESIVLGKSQSALACGAKGIGEICSIPTAPAVQLAYFNRDGKFRTRLPLEDTPYRKK